jgi:hypothetical protein
VASKNRPEILGRAKKRLLIAIYALYPVTGKRFLKWKYGLEPVPGKIVDLDKKESDTVNQGETVLVLEVMKMENVLAAPVSSTIAKIPSGIGDHVAMNDVLCLIVPS